MKNWSDLNQTQKEVYRKYCDDKFGKTCVFSETGEPLYMDKDAKMINTKVIIELLFNYQKS
jgi:hypothetical protein